MSQLALFLSFLFLIKFDGISVPFVVLLYVTVHWLSNDSVWIFNEFDVKKTKINKVIRIQVIDFVSTNNLVSILTYGSNVNV